MSFNGRNLKMSNMAFVCSLFVVCQHLNNDTSCDAISYYVGKLFFNGVCAIAVPYFFVASGYFLAKHVGESGWWRTAVAERFKTVVLPFWKWNVVYFIFLLILAAGADFMHGGRNVANALSVEQFTRALGIDLFKKPLLIPFWYMRSLMLFVLVSPIIVFLINRCGRLMLLFLYVVGLAFPPAFTSNSGFDVFRTYTFSIYGAFYFAFGVFIRRSGFVVRNSKLASALALLIAVALLVCSRFILRTRLPFMETIHIPLALYGIYGLIPAKNVFGILGGCSFEIYAIHVFVIQLFQCLVTKSVSTDLAMMAQCLFVFGLTITISFCLHRFLPGWSRSWSLWPSRKGGCL